MRTADGLRVIGTHVSPEDPEPEEVFHLRMPVWRVEQLCVLADSLGTLATTMVTDWVLERLDEQDPGDSPAPVTGPVNVETAEVIPFPTCT
jgi:hypothetical protein